MSMNARLDPERVALEAQLSHLPAHFRDDARNMPDNMALLWESGDALESAALDGEPPVAAVTDRLKKPDPTSMSEDRAAQVIGAITASVLRTRGWHPDGRSASTGAAWPKNGAVFDFGGVASMFWTPTKVFAGLAGASRLANWGWLMDEWGQLITFAEPPETVSLAGHKVPAAALRKLCSQTNRNETQVISPAGARFLVSLYEAGVLEVKGRRRAVSEELRAYCLSEPALLERRRIEVEKAQRQAQADTQEQVRLRDLASFSEADFTAPLLDRIFIANRGPGDGVLTIGGVKVSKFNRRYASNSGKSSSWHVTFEWHDAAGAVQRRRISSAHEGNRRNDAARNWGVPE